MLSHGLRRLFPLLHGLTLPVSLSMVCARLPSECAPSIRPRLVSRPGWCFPRRSGRRKPRRCN